MEPKGIQGMKCTSSVTSYLDSLFPIVWNFRTTYIISVFFLFFIFLSDMCSLRDQEMHKEKPEHVQESHLLVLIFVKILLYI